MNYRTGENVEMKVIGLISPYKIIYVKDYFCITGAAKTKTNP